eukprot:1443231-Pyramimonas_sp.AAC.1
MLRIVIQESLVCVKERWPSLFMCAMVDDIALSLVGSAKRVRVVLGNAIPDLCRQLEKLEMVVSKKKCQIMASSPRIADLLGKALKGRRFNVCAAVKNLGHDLSQQCRKGRKVLRRRIAKLRRRARRSRALKHHWRGLAR